MSGAEKVFSAVGYSNAKMEDIAMASGITKVTLYAYYQSKENLYMAFTYYVLQQLIDKMYDTIDLLKNASGLDGTVAIIKTFMDFCEQKFIYAEALLDYFAIVRATSHGEDHSKISQAMQDSLYYRKLQDLHNLPFKLTAKEIVRGQKDGSILPDLDPMFYTLHGWTQVIGYIKVLAASGENVNPLFNVNLKDLKKLSLKITKKLLSSDQFQEALTASGIGSTTARTTEKSN